MLFFVLIMPFFVLIMPKNRIDYEKKPIDYEKKRCHNQYAFVLITIDNAPGWTVILTILFHADPQHVLLWDAGVALLLCLILGSL